MTFRELTLAALALGPTLLGCQSSPRDVRPWQASDHDRSEEQQPLQAPPQPVTAESASPHQRGAMAGRAMQVWVSQCIRCHGRVGAGDGPDGAALGATDLSNAAWQSAVTNEQIAQAIVRGKGRMPAFPLEPEVAADLVELIRRMRNDSVGAAPEMP